MPSAAHAGPTPVPEGDGANRNNSTSQSESQQNKRDLASWWKQFKRSEKKGQEQQAPPVQGIFGVPLSVSIRYANVAISLFNEDGQGYIYGYVPIVVAKCGVFLKEKATDVEGIFRLAGSEKRIKELKVAFDSPDRYGKGLDWTGYTVHDAANILRRYFNQLPEPIIPLNFYDKFRDPLRGHEAEAVGSAGQVATEAASSTFDLEAAIKVYQVLITELPPLNRQLLLYILDLLAVFASKSDLNKMTTSNLAAIFQPGLLSHPQHDMAPHEYRLSQDVLIFLIENQDSFLIGMPGTAADQQTVDDVQSGAASPGRTAGASTSPSRSKTVVGRSSSNASNGTEGRWGTLRRNVSVSSKQSKQSGNGPTPLTPASTNAGTSGVQRSNTVPSRRGGSASHSPRFSRDKGSESGTHSPLAGTGTGAALETPSYGSSQNTPVAPTSSTFSAAPIEVTSASSSEATTPLADVVGRDRSPAAAHDLHTPRKDTTPLLAPPSTSSSGAVAASDADRSASNTPSTSGRGFLNILKQSPSSEGDGRKPNKLQKKRIPGSALSSAQSSSNDLGDDTHSNQVAHTPVSPQLPPYAAGESTSSASPAIQRNPTDATLRRAPSPSQSAHSHTSVTDQSDADMVGDDMPAQSAEAGAGGDKQKRRHRWRFSRSQNKLESGSSTSTNPLGTLSSREQTMSKSTIGSQPPRRGSQEPASLLPEPHTSTSGAAATGEQTVFSDSEKEKKGPLGWIRGKIHERKEKEAEKRAKSPEGKSGSSGIEESLPVRGTSFDTGRSTGPSTAPTTSTAAGQSSAVTAATSSTTPAQAASSPEQKTSSSGHGEALTGQHDTNSGVVDTQASAANNNASPSNPLDTTETANTTERVLPTTQ